MESCHRRLDRLEEELQSVVDPAKRKLEKAAEKAPKGPPANMLDRPEGNGDKEFLKGLGDWYEGFDGNVRFWEEQGLGDGARMRLAGMRDGAAYAVDNPKEFAKAAANWEEWQRSPVRAFGKISPELLLFLATSGGSGALTGVRAFRTAAQRLAGREGALRRNGSARDRADGEPAKNDKQQGERQKTGEPIDVATGEMVMSATNIALPGALPLTLTRHYVSGHPCGGWFGPTWAATLDQRLELDDAGIVYVADDGMVLTYPIPEAEVPAFPVSGPRWPLLWDGKPDGAMTVTVPERNRTLHFAPLPVSRRELALQAITDRTGEGDRVTFTYDAEGTPVEIAHSGGYRVAVDTDEALHRITALRLLHGEHHEHGTPLISYAYDAAGDLTEIVNSTGEPLRYRYDDEHRITSWTDRNGTSFAYVYDHRGRVLRTIGPDGMMSGRLHYDPAARTTRYTDSLGRTTTYVYNEAYKVTSITDPLGHTTHTEWDAAGRRPVRTTDPLGRTTRHTYDEDGNLTAVERPDGTVTEATYDAWGLPLTIRDPGGGVWRHTYDERGARTSTTDPAGARTAYAYDAAGHLSSLTDARGHTTSVTTDGAGLPLTLTDPLGHTTHVRRGPHGRITALTDPLGHTTRQGWTIEGRPAWREDPDGARETWEWDGEGNLLTHTDAAGHTTQYTHTHFDLPATRTDPDGACYAFAYDTELRLVGVTNPQGRQWSYDFDAAGRLVAETDFNGAQRTYELDAAGGLLARTNACGETLRYELDALGRVQRQHCEADGEVTTYAYDATGALTHTANPSASVTLDRDPVGRVLTETVNGRTVTYAYDAAGNRTSRTTPSGHTSTWTYDAAARPMTLATEGGALSFTYDAAGRETHRRLGERATLTQRWDPSDRLTQQHIQGPDEQILQHRAYTYRPDGYVTEIRELTTGTRHFALDKAGRVTGVQAHGWTERYAYDAAGNQAEASAPAHPSPGKREHTGTLIHRAGHTRYEHDAAGRLTRKTRHLLNGQTQTWTYTWSPEDRLTRVVTPQGEEWTYTYDPLGRRLTKSGPHAYGLTFTWDGTRVTEQTATDNTTLTWDYTPGTHRPLTQTTHDPLLKTSEFHAIVTDTVGTPTELISANGQLAHHPRTTLWGTRLPAPPDTVTCPLRYPGQYADPETGLHYNYFRYYDPETGRYVTPDPLGLGPGPNQHAYAHSPMTWTDPLGLKKCTHYEATAGETLEFLKPTQKTRTWEQEAGQESLSNEELLEAIHNPRDGDEILILRDGRQLGGHHRIDELRRRVEDGRISPDTPIKIKWYDPDEDG
ncbi:DUF6531 domain-containing protein [Streptomyces iconiensis]|uniref:DUF6531 domain-containing protein n=1 Tax=Streptomyces iconiensis TaxID=1384038 RepID=UPI0032190835